MEKTLYLTDLDGTLLRSHQKVSLFTAQTISRLVEQGMLFSYATARSFVTAEPLTREIRGRIPVIVYNGALIVDHQTHEILHSHVFSSQQVEEIYSQLMHSAVFPIVYGHIGGREVFCYCPSQINEATRAFLDTERGMFGIRRWNIRRICVAVTPSILPVLGRRRSCIRCTRGFVSVTAASIKRIFTVGRCGWKSCPKAVPKPVLPGN